MKRIPFDSLCVAAAVSEIQMLIGAKVRSVHPLDPSTMVMELMAAKDFRIVIGWHPQFPRIHLSGRQRHFKGIDIPFVNEIRKRLIGANLSSVKQVSFDRVVQLRFMSDEGELSIVHELLGTRANAYLVDPQFRILSSARRVAANLRSEHYQFPRLQQAQSLLQISSLAGVREFDHLSPFLLSWIQSEDDLTFIQNALMNAAWSPILAHEFGCYPISISKLGYAETKMSTFSLAAEMYFEGAISKALLDAKRDTLRSRLLQFIRSRETALKEIDKRLADANRVSRLQLEGELILAYASTIEEGQAVLRTSDYDGNAMTIHLDSCASPKENAQRRFEKAKRAKHSAPFLVEQRARLATDLRDAESAANELDDADIDTVERLQGEAQQRKWLIEQHLPKRKEDRPYEGRRIREFAAEGGWTVLVGENAEANDYLTLRVAKPDDWWLHVRGATSAHVIVQTKKQPDRVPRSVLIFAGKLAVRFSSQKHAGIVPVDYTLRKYVRRQRGAPPGSVVYEREKTLHLERE